MQENTNFQIYKGQTFKGTCAKPVIVTRKLDGVHCVLDKGVWTSRTGKPLYNLPLGVADGHYEAFRNSWEDTISVVRSSRNADIVPLNYTELYSICDPDSIDERLTISRSSIETPTSIEERFRTVKDNGDEGLVIYADGKMYKHKGVMQYYDVPVKHVVEGKGKFKGMLGYFITPFGGVGTGLTTKQREQLFTNDMIGKIIEVKCQEITKDGKFRFPVFVRVREDK